MCGVSHRAGRYMRAYLGRHEDIVGAADGALAVVVLPYELAQQLLALPLQPARAVAVGRVEPVDALAQHVVEDPLQLHVRLLRVTPQELVPPAPGAHAHWAHPQVAQLHALLPAAGAGRGPQGGRRAAAQQSVEQPRLERAARPRSACRRRRPQRRLLEGEGPRRIGQEEQDQDGQRRPLQARCGQLHGCLPVGCGGLSEWCVMNEPSLLRAVADGVGHHGQDRWGLRWISTAIRGSGAIPSALKWTIEADGVDFRLNWIEFRVVRGAGVGQST